MLIFILLVLSAYTVLSVKVFHSMIAHHSLGRTGEGRRDCLQESGEGASPVRGPKSVWWLYPLYLLHLSACAGLMVSVILFDVRYFDQIRLVFFYAMIVEALSFIPVFLLHSRQL